jgi:transcription elongation factor GreB
MSKAFTRESDDTGALPAVPRPVSTLPPGVKNYLTRAGAERLQKELHTLIEIERPRVTAGSSGPEARESLAALEQRIGSLQASLESAEVVDPPPKPWDRVRFGATVTVRERGGSETAYRIVGIDEIDVDRGWLSWRSPIASALLNTRVGQRVRFRIPAGEEELEILSIHYE